MEKRMLWLGLMLMVVGLCSSGALATGMGPPVAGLDAGQFRIGLDISTVQTGVQMREESSWTRWHSEEDFFDGTRTNEDYWKNKGKDKDEFITEFQSDMTFANLGYGVTDNVEVFLRLGLSDLDGFGGEPLAVDDLAYGLGAKATIYEDGKLKLGSLIQLTLFNFDGDRGFVNDDTEVSGPISPAFPNGDLTETFRQTGSEDWEIDYYEVKLAVGPIYELTKGVSIYGGPFLQLLDGDVDSDEYETEEETYDWRAGEATGWEVDEERSKNSIEFKQRSRYGLYFGVQIACGENIVISAEYQTANDSEMYSNDSDVYSASLAYAF
jgi:opacity protein-like surface antigen